MILMAVYVIGNLSLSLGPVVLSIWEKAMEFWHGWRDASDFAAHAYGKGMRDMCTYHSSLLHVSNIENTITLLFFPIGYLPHCLRSCTFQTYAGMFISDESRFRQRNLSSVQLGRSIPL
jgi:hypothetical protein